MSHKASTSKKTEDDYLEERKHQATKEFVKKLKGYMIKKDRSNDALQLLINKQKDGLYTRKNKGQIVPLLNEAQRTLESELDSYRKLISDVEKIRQRHKDAKMEGLVRRQTLMAVVHNEAAALPLYIDPHAPYPPYGVGAIGYPDSHTFEKGDFVAANIEENWILAEVEDVVSNAKVSVRDIEDGKTEIVVKRKVLGLPEYRADPLRDAHALFPVDAIVLALYPQTTCFYKGAVVSTPKCATEDYLIAFEDPSYAGGYSTPMPAAQRYVLTYREIKRSHKKKEVYED
ncbi:unnamed protein product, partial [Mesorhabditis spiculigera]